MSETAQVRITRREGSPLTGTLVEVDGKELPELHRVTFDHECGGLAYVNADMYAHEGFEFECPAVVELSLVVPQGCTLEEVEMGDGRRLLRVVERA